MQRHSRLVYFLASQTPTLPHTFHFHRSLPIFKFILIFIFFFFETGTLPNQTLDRQKLQRKKERKKMSLSDNIHYCRQSLMPSFLYSSSSSSKRLFDLDALLNTNHLLSDQSSPSVSSSSNGSASKGFVIPAPKEKIEMHSPAFYAACTAGGILSCGLTHTAVTPLDLVKCNMQVLFIFSLFFSFVFFK